jgi:hypothetical protein
MPPANIPHVSRRDVLRTVGAGALALGVSASSVAADGDSETRSGYVIEQGDTCYPVEPLGDGTTSVETFYNYSEESDFSSAGTTALQREDTSIVFLYDGSEGLSLVFVHGAAQGDSDGGSASVTISRLPDGTEWVVEDDRYPDDSQFDRWSTPNGSTTVDWTWTNSRTDGGALRGFDGEFAVTVEMQFNEAAALFGEYYEGRVTAWEFLTGDASDPKRRTLSVEEPLVVRTGTCDGDNRDDPDDEETEEKDDDETEDKEHDEKEDDDEDEDDDDDPEEGEPRRDSEENYFEERNENHSGDDDDGDEDEDDDGDDEFEHRGPPEHANGQGPPEHANSQGPPEHANGQGPPEHANGQGPP